MDDKLLQVIETQWSRRDECKTLDPPKQKNVAEAQKAGARVPRIFAHFNVVHESVVVHSWDVLCLPALVVRVPPPIGVDERVELVAASFQCSRAKGNLLVSVQPSAMDVLEVGERVTWGRLVHPLLDVVRFRASVSDNLPCLSPRPRIAFAVRFVYNVSLEMIALDVELNLWRRIDRRIGIRIALLQLHVILQIFGRRHGARPAPIDDVCDAKDGPAPGSYL